MFPNDILFCPKCQRFLSFNQLNEDSTIEKGFSNMSEPLNRCKYCNGDKFEIYYGRCDG